MKTKWLAGIVGMALLLGMLVLGCSSEDRDTIITLKDATGGKATHVTFDGKGVSSLPAKFIVTPGEEYIITATVNGDSLVEKVTVAYGKEKTVTIGRTPGGSILVGD
ncbi:hypothetical protein AGMMS49942_10010 [Spirochaetia bacterium]|nr:hypothetical protein AGMMS49942_10010 [Spirochaetia bacterium]